MQQMLFVSDKQKEKQQSLNIKIMATTTVNFQQDGSDYISDIIIAQSNTLAFRIKVDKPGSIILERSITGDNFISEIGLPPSHVPGDTLSIEKNITGIVAQQQLRFRFQNCKPVSISVLQ